MYTKLGFSALRTFERVYLLPDNSKNSNKWEMLSKYHCCSSFSVRNFFFTRANSSSG